MFFYDPTYLCFMLPAILLMMFAQWRVSHAYSKWGKVRNTLNLTGLDAARRLLSSGGIGGTGLSTAEGLAGVRVAGIGGQLTDRYDPSNNTLYLSQGVAQTPSVAAIAVAAHEIGHAIQQAEGYAPLRLRSLLVPAVNIGSYLGWILIFGGLVLGILQIAWLGVLFFSLGAVFALATLPVEFDASRRARAILAENGMLPGAEDIRGVNEVLNAAAMTYVAGLATAVMQLLYYVTLLGGMGGRRRS
ncbi:MAG: zinc metallopeptidase [Anaerolineales bacterium]|nr:zinc metallopeptidase [Anaerolineales bacterium]